MLWIRSAQHRVADDDRRPDEHGGMVVGPEQAVEQRTHGLEAGGCVGDEENQDDDGRETREQVLFVMPAAGKEIRHRESAQIGRVAAQPPRHDQPVEIGAHGQPDDGPADLGRAGQVGKAGQAHQKVAAHVAGLGAHRRDDGPQPPPAQVELLRRAAAAAAEPRADRDHADQVDDDSRQNADLCTAHKNPSSFSAKRRASFARPAIIAQTDTRTQHRTVYRRQSIHRSA